MQMSHSGHGVDLGAIATSAGFASVTTVTTPGEVAAAAGAAAADERRAAVAAGADCAGRDSAGAAGAGWGVSEEPVPGESRLQSVLTG